MKITAQEEYGLRCLLRLARGSALTIPDIAAAEGLSQAYVGKLLGQLKQAGLITSHRGRTGGYLLTQAPEKMGMGNVLFALGEPLFDEPDYCQRHAGTETSECVHHGSCSLRPIWSALDLLIRKTLDQLTLADLLQGQERIQEILGDLAGAPAEPKLTFVPIEPMAKSEYV